MDDSKEGVVYFSFGSNVFSKNIPPERMKTIMEALAELPFKVLWKFEEEELPGRPSNVRLEKWMPQTDVLSEYKGSSERSVERWFQGTRT